MYKIIGADQKEYGPVTADQITQWLAAGRVNALTRTQAVGGEWKPLSEFPEFAAALGQRAPAASSAPPGLPPYSIHSSRPASTSGLGVASLVLGILGFVTCGVSAIVGLILGIIAMSHEKKSGRSAGGIALAGTIVSALFILMLPIGFAMFLPALAKAKQRAETIHCINNVRQLALASLMYAGSHTNQLPAAATWCDDVKSFVTDTAVFRCPTAGPGDRCDYAFNSRLDGVNLTSINPNTVLLFESSDGWNRAGGPEILLQPSRHGRTFVVAFADGHIEQITASQLAGLRWNP